MTSEGSPPVPDRDDGAGARTREVPLDLDTSVAHVARVYDYWLGGKDNFSADRVAEWRPDSELEAATPTVLWGGVARKA